MWIVLVMTKTNILDVKTLEVSKGLEIVFSEPKGEHEIAFTFLVAH